MCVPGQALCSHPLTDPAAARSPTRAPAPHAPQLFLLEATQYSMASEQQRAAMHVSGAGGRRASQSSSARAAPSKGWRGGAEARGRGRGARGALP